MRLTRFRSFLLVGGSLLLLGPAIGLSQPGNFGPPGGFQGGPPGGFQGGPGGFQGGGNRGGGNRGGGRQFDPNMIFNMISGGKDYIDVQQYLPMAQMRDPNAADKINEFMQRMGITNGQLTRDQFAQFMQERIAQRQAQRGQGNPNGPNPTDPNNPAANPDTTVDDNGEPPPPEDKRSVIYRASNLPQGLPAWFGSYDSDRDGQVGLYEWKAQGRSVSDFQTIDLNGDGFITIDEALRYQKATGGPTIVSNGGPSFGGGFNGQSPNGFSGFNGNNGGQRGNFGNFGGQRGGNGGQRGGRQRGGQQNPYGQ